MKKRIFLFIFFSLLLIINAIGLYLNYFSNEDVVLASENLAGNRNNALTMMLETDVDSNEYEVATSNEWPQEGYIFNAEMSACERGGTLSWDSENNRVVMASGSADKCYVYFDRYTTVSITNVTTSNITNSSITLTAEVTTGENTIATYYFSSNDGLSYEESTNNTYTFNNLEQGVEYNFRVYAVDTNGISSNVYTLSESTLSTLYFADYIKNTVYTGDGNEGIYYHDGVGDYTNASEEAGDNSYRYAGANPNNYVCFGSDAETCSNDDLYRIIGVFGDQVKLIKNDYTTTQLGTNGDYYGIYESCEKYVDCGLDSTYKGNIDGSLIGTYYWNNNTQVNTWSRSRLNTRNLNTNYINYLNNQDTKWAEMIETTTWQVGGNTWVNIVTTTVKNAYTNEMVSPSENITYDAKIGLMYVSDYYYAASPTYWSYVGYDTWDASIDYRAATGNNWMYIGLYEWTISRESDDTSGVFCVSFTGNVNGHDVYYYNYGSGDLYTNESYAVRPSFYLKSNIAITSGDGSQNLPFRLSIA